MKNARTISVSEFKAKCLRLLDEVGSGSELVIQKRGKPIARVTRVENGAPATSFGSWSEKISLSGNIVHPGWEKVFDFE